MYFLGNLFIFNILNFQPFYCMIKIILSVFVLTFSFYNCYSQNLSYSCPRTINLSCGTACITLNAKFPDLRALADDYSFLNVSAAVPCYPLVDPGVPGNPTNLTIDDTYSAVINLPFPFPFYGIQPGLMLIHLNGILQMFAHHQMYPLYML